MTAAVAAEPFIASFNISSYPQLQGSGLAFRQPKKGPELELVLHYIHTQLQRPAGGLSRTVFLEPRMEAGFPDIVVVDWDDRVVRQWPSARIRLIPADMQVLHSLASRGASNEVELRKICRRSLLSSLERLLAADVVELKDGQWSAKPLRQIYAVRRLLAIEAKISAWGAGLAQALSNTTFASESYLLLPRVPRSGLVVEEAQRLGVGVVTRDAPPQPTPAAARSGRLPRSHVAWLFNEWAWRTTVIHCQ